MYSTIESVDDALNSRPHILDGKEVDPKRAVAREVCDVAALAECGSAVRIIIIMELCASVTFSLVQNSTPTAAISDCTVNNIIPCHMVCVLYTVIP